jgi:hypothetical protein
LKLYVHERDADRSNYRFWTNWPELQQSKDAVKDTLNGVKWLLEVGTKQS